MADYLIQDTTLIGIADAIRSKTGGDDPIKTDDMAGMIQAIQTGGGGLTHETKTGGDLALFDIIKFGRYNGRDLFWFVSDTGYEGDVILTIMPDQLEQMKFNTGGEEYEKSRYRTSSIRQFLNSESVEWYSQQIEGAEDPENIGDPGFLSDFSEYELSKIVPHNCKCVEYSAYQVYEVVTVTDKVFLPSKKQCGGTAGTAEGSRAFEATSMSLDGGIIVLRGPEIFSPTRTQRALGDLEGGSSTSYYHWPVCVGMSPEVSFRRLVISPESGITWLEVV